MGRRQKSIPRNEASRGWDIASKRFNGIKTFLFFVTVQYLQNENINDKLYI